jgi:hypothetical protein
MNETNLASIVLGLIAGFYTTIFLLCLSDVIYLNKEMSKMKIELADIRNINSNRTLSVDHSTSLNFSSRQTISGPLCLSYHEQRQILDYINFICNMAILFFGIYSIYIYGFGTHHGLTYRLIFFLLKICTIILSICLNFSFKQGLPSDIFLYIWIDVNCVASIYRSIRQRM